MVGGGCSGPDGALPGGGVVAAWTATLASAPRRVLREKVRDLVRDVGGQHVGLPHHDDVLGRDAGVIGLSNIIVQLEDIEHLPVLIQGQLLVAEKRIERVFERRATDERNDRRHGRRPRFC